MENNYNDPRRTQQMNRPPYPTMPEQQAGYQREVSFGDAIRMAFNKYCVFSGRASRSEFWWWSLFIMLIATAAYIIDSDGYVAALCNLAILLPSLGLACRRLHDIGRAAGWIFINLIPVVGGIIFLVWSLTPSEPRPNRFGPVPNMA